MRSRGARFELLRMRPNDHIGWVFSAPEEFARLTKPFLAEGASKAERLMYVAEDPDPEAMSGLVSTLDPGVLQITSIAEVYGPTGVVDAIAQRATFSSALADALEEGYSGIRVAADNTPLVTDPERLEAWIRWEIVADRFMSENRVTGLCAFNRERVDVDTLRHLSTLHPLSSAESPTPQFLLFSEDGSLYIEGEVDSLAIEQVLLALQSLPPKTDVIVDLTKTALITKAAMTTLHHLLVSGVGISLRGASEAARNIGAIAGMPVQCFS